MACNCGEQLYGDCALSEALNIVLQLSLSIPINELMAYPKVYCTWIMLLVLCFQLLVVAHAVVMRLCFVPCGRASGCGLVLLEKGECAT